MKTRGEWFHCLLLNIITFGIIGHILQHIYNWKLQVIAILRIAKISVFLTVRQVLMPIFSQGRKDWISCSRPLYYIWSLFKVLVCYVRKSKGGVWGCGVGIDRF